MLGAQQLSEKRRKSSFMRDFYGKFIWNKKFFLSCRHSLFPLSSPLWMKIICNNFPIEFIFPFSASSWSYAWKLFSFQAHSVSAKVRKILGKFLHSVQCLWCSLFHESRIWFPDDLLLFYSLHNKPAESSHNSSSTKKNPTSARAGWMVKDRWGRDEKDFRDFLWVFLFFLCSAQLSCVEFEVFMMAQKSLVMNAWINLIGISWKCSILMATLNKKSAFRENMSSLPKYLHAFSLIELDS